MSQKMNPGCLRPAPALLAIGFLLSACNLPLPAPFSGAENPAALATSESALGEGVDSEMGGDRDNPPLEDYETLYECPNMYYEKTAVLIYDHNGEYVNSKGQKFGMKIQGTQRIRIVAGSHIDDFGDNSEGIHNIDEGPIRATMTASNIGDCPPGSGVMQIKAVVKGTCIDDQLTLYITEYSEDFGFITLTCPTTKPMIPLFSLRTSTVKWQMPISEASYKKYDEETAEYVWFGGKMRQKYILMGFT